MLILYLLLCLPCGPCCSFLVYAVSFVVLANINDAAT